MTPREKELVRRAVWSRLAAMPSDVRAALRPKVLRDTIRYVKDQMRLWRARETAFPARVRRAEPDDMDIEAGTWPIDPCPNQQ